jgi:hypothetical protein
VLIGMANFINLGSAKLEGGGALKPPNRAEFLIKAGEFTKQMQL